MRVALSTLGKFHTFDLARELHARGALAGILTGYPRFKLRQEALPQELIHTFPYVHTPYMAFLSWQDRMGVYWKEQWEYFDARTFAAYAARNLPECDVYVGLSRTALQAGKKAKQRGARYVCDRGSSHIRTQEQILREEHERWGLPFSFDPRVIDAEEAEYREADCITVPSQFSYRSFLSQGISPEKLRLLPYGVDLTRFEPVGKPATCTFDVLFVGSMSLRKGIPYLTQAFQKMKHPGKTLSFAGTVSQELITLLKQKNLWPDEARVLGPLPQSQLKNVMSRSHVMVLPSVEDGFGLVMAQAMACGCPVLATHNTGAEDLFTDGREGFIVPIRDVDALADRMQIFAHRPQQRADLGQSALAKVQSLGGWQHYGDNAISIYRDLMKSATTVSAI